MSPEVVDPGEVITISGRATPGEEIWLGSSFELSLPVGADGGYSREFKDIHFPEGEKKFSMRAENIKNIRVSVSPIFWQTIEYPLEGPRDATNGIASLSISFPVSTKSGTFDIKGKKDVRVYGDAVAGATSVSLETATASKVVADSNGDFLLDLNTGGIPEGEFMISAGEIEKRTYIGVTPTSPLYPSPTPSTSTIKQPWGKVAGIIIVIIVIAVLIIGTVYFYRSRKE